MTIEQMKQEVCDYSRQSYSEKLFAGTSGNLSLFNGEIMVITPTSIAYETITAEDMVAMKLDGTVLEGKHNPSSEWRMHAAVYEAKPEVRAIIHTHSPYATAFAVNNKSIPTILIEMVPFLGGDIPLALFAVPGTREVGLEAVKVLKERTGCLLANHGVLTVGDTLARAHIRAIYVEDAAKICSIAMGNGEIVTIPEKYISVMGGK
ncbi:MAG: class II aldolase/adducin family protein [Oscillospiraceae bacterium]|nr:class II aldolase/adducin family protein [Oscillospiraceae bacterium]